MENNIEKSVSFTGHRPNKLGGYELKSPKNIAIAKAIRSEIIKLIETQNVDKFISGGALGVDTMAFLIVNKLKETYPNIKNILAIPFENQDVKWQNESRALFNKMKGLADEVVLVDTLENTKYYCDLNGLGNYHPAKMQKRNEYMVDHSKYVIAVWDGTKGGTYNCVQYAKKMDKNIIQINPREVMK